MYLLDKGVEKPFFVMKNYSFKIAKKCYHISIFFRNDGRVKS